MQEMHLKGYQRTHRTVSDLVWFIYQRCNRNKHSLQSVRTAKADYYEICLQVNLDKVEEVSQS